MIYVEAPKYVSRIEIQGTTNPSLFLGGGISNCPDWQAHVADKLSRTNLLVLNPRRNDFDIADPTASDVQIRWEHYYLEHVDAVMFWFPKETLCPITLFEYGKELGKLNLTYKKIFVGTDPEYKRRFDVVLQTALVTREIIVHNSLEGVVGEILRWEHGTGFK